MRSIWIVLGTLALLAAALMPVVQLDHPRACDTLVDSDRACVVRPKVVAAIAQRPDGTPVPATIREQVLVWQIDRSAAYELDLHPTADGGGVPAIHVEDSLGQTVSDRGSGWRARTRTLAPGAYRIHVTGGPDTPRELVLSIAPLPPATASS